MSTLDNTKLLQEQIRKLLEATEKDYEYFLGFPGSLDFDYSDLMLLQNKLLNNIGDPLTPAFHGLSSKAMEQEVLCFFAKLFRAEKDKWWGYATNGSTEGNLYALYIARNKLPGAKVFYSKDAHYSIPKNIHILGIQGVEVASQKSGEIDYIDLAKNLTLAKASPAIIVANIGTTMTEAKDDVAKIRQVLGRTHIKDYFIHCDAALAGPYTAVLEPHHPFDFADGASSVSISGHKFIGSPMPCGLVLVYKADKELLRAKSNYTGTIDTTISGSRNGHTPLFLWYSIKKWGLEGLKKRAEDSQIIAQYAFDQLEQIGWPAMRNPNALTIVIDSPPEDILHRWQLATEKNQSHIICMPGITKDKIDRFVADLKALKT
jgi:histidine decarboxylase